jgi:hypothetical protein
VMSCCKDRGLSEARRTWVGVNVCLSVRLQEVHDLITNHGHSSEMF